RHVRVALPAEVGRAEVFLTGQERDPGFTEDVHVRRLQPQSVISASREAPPPSEGALPGVLKAPPKYRAGVGLSRPGPWAPRLRGQRSGAVPVAEPARVGAALARPGLWPQDVRGLRAVSIRRVAVAEVNVRFQPTPNPNAGKFVTDREVVPGGKSRSYHSREEAAGDPLAAALMAIEGVDN